MQNAGVPKVVLKPDLVSIASFPEIPPPFESVLLFSSVICIGEYNSSFQNASRTSKGPTEGEF